MPFLIHLLLCLLFASCGGSLIDPPQTTPVGTAHRANDADTNLKILGGGLKGIELQIPASAMPAQSELQAFPVEDMDLKSYGVTSLVLESDAMEVTLNTAEKGRLVEFLAPVTLLWPVSEKKANICVLMTSSQGSYKWSQDHLSYDEALGSLSMTTMFPGVYQMVICDSQIPEAFRDASFTAAQKGLKELKIQIPSDVWLSSGTHHVCGYIAISDEQKTILSRQQKQVLSTSVEFIWKLPVSPVEIYGVEVSLWAQDPFQECSLNEGEALSDIESEQRLDFSLKDRALAEATTLLLGTDIEVGTVSLTTNAVAESITRSLPSFARQICVEVSSSLGKSFQRSYLSEQGLFDRENAIETFTTLGTENITMNVHFGESCMTSEVKTSLTWTQRNTTDSAFYMYPVSLSFSDSSQEQACLLFRDTEQKASGFLTVSPRISNPMYLPWTSATESIPSLEMHVDTSSGCLSLTENEDRSYTSYVLSKDMTL